MRVAEIFLSNNSNQLAEMALGRSIVKRPPLGEKILKYLRSILGVSEKEKFDPVLENSLHLKDSRAC